MYILEGNIGVGKSTFLTLVEQYCPQLSAIPEPKENWATQATGQSLLGNFYQDPQRWAYTIETLAMICRVKDHLREQVNPNPNRIMERSVYSGHFCFAMNDNASGYLTNLEWDIYLKWVDFLVHRQCKPPLGFIYLRATPQVCFDRMKKRNRKGEEALSLDYMTKLGMWHEKFLFYKKGLPEHLKGVPVLVLDCNEDFVENRENTQKHLTKVAAFVRETQCAGRGERDRTADPLRVKQVL